MIFSRPAKRLLPWFLVTLVWIGLSSLVHAGPLKKTQSELEQARENLRVSEATEERIAAELDKFKKSGQTAPEIINDYEVYLGRVQAITDENRRVLTKMEATYARHVPRKKSSDQEASRNLEEMMNPSIQEEQAVDELAALDREFNDSLTEFDEMLLEELDAIRIESAEKMRDLAQEAEEAARRLREKGIDLDRPESCGEGEEGGEGEAQEGKESTGGKGESGSGSSAGEGKEAGTSTGSSGENSGGKGGGYGQGGDGDTSGGKGQQGPSRKKERAYDDDDDIVARQLREAAENETDPELKEKLWKEYEEYKKGL
ncbi:MAG: hypothetical protein JRI47_00215 [Deltaproteobacteria bacterium]|nr:hypothetical protein [Deltaproteobacteria bacterium]